MIFKKITLFLLIVFLFVSAFAQNTDIDILKFINENGSTFKNNYFKATSQSVTIFNIAAPLSLLTAGIINHDNKLKEDAAYMAGGFIVSTIVTQAMKNVIQRTRPFETYKYLIKRDVGGGYSFPSGHTSSAFCTATSLSLIFPKWYVIVPSYLYAASVGYARMYQGVHYPSDVLAGAIVGAGSAWLSYKIEKKMHAKRINNTKKITAFL